MSKNDPKNDISLAYVEKKQYLCSRKCKDMNEQYPTAICVALNYLEDRGWTELIDPRWAPELLEEFRRSGLGWTDEEIIEVVNQVLHGKAEWDSTDRLDLTEDMWPTRQEQINTSITYNGFSEHTLQLIDNYINDILYGRTNIHRFDLQEHAGLCTGGAPLIGAYAVCCYARASFEPGRFSLKCKTDSPTNWEIDAKQEEVLHNTLFPETQMKVIGFTRDSDGLFRVVLTQPYVPCERLATKAEIDALAASKGFHDNRDGNGVNYIGERLYLEDMHPANVFIDPQSGKPICIDCIVKFIKTE